MNLPPSIQLKLTLEHLELYAPAASCCVLCAGQANSPQSCSTSTVTGGAQKQPDGSFRLLAVGCFFIGGVRSKFYTFPVTEDLEGEMAVKCTGMVKTYGIKELNKEDLRSMGTLAFKNGPHRGERESPRE